MKLFRELTLIVTGSLFAMALALPAKASIVSGNCPPNAQIETTGRLFESELGPRQEEDVATEFDNRPNRLDDIPNSFQQALSWAVNAELRRLNRQYSLTNQQLQQIKDACKNEIIFTASMLETKLSFVDYDFMNDIEPSLQKAVWERAKSFLPEGGSDAFEAYKKDCLETTDLLSTAGRIGLVLGSNDFLSLTPKQMYELESVYVSNWKSIWNDQVLMMLFNSLDSGDKILYSVRDSKVKAILTAEQFAVFKSLNEYDYDGSSLTAQEFDVELFEERCSTLMDLKIDQLNKLCELDDVQMKKLSIAKKGAISRVARRWEALADKEEVDWSEAWKMTQTPVLEQCVQESVWSNTVAKVLGNEQRSKLDALDQKLVELKSFYFTNGFVSVFRQILGESFSLEKHQALAGFLSGTVVIDSDTTFQTMGNELWKSDFQPLAEVFNEEEWGHIKPLLDQIKQNNEVELEAEIENELNDG